MQASNLRGAEAPTSKVTWPLRPEDDGEGVAGLEELALPASVSARIKPSRYGSPGELPGNRTQLDAG